jgi:hypothetical protein
MSWRAGDDFEARIKVPGAACARFDTAPRLAAVCRASLKSAHTSVREIRSVGINKSIL